ncbi:hypothetical protein BC832DRAFT_605779 [Gaertneriomyces semiglobifer]|nr:hypothetical protein BC832DRAFT_605779 [Gaertneriomyces semiglobifer]
MHSRVQMVRREHIKTAPITTSKVTSNVAGRRNDSEVAQGMNKRVAFINRRILKRRAKSRSQQTKNFYQEKMKQAEVQRKIQQSNHVNKCRLQVLQVRQQVLDFLMFEAKKRPSDLSESRLGIKVDLIAESGLGEGCTGGVVVGAHAGRIRVSNTLEGQLELCGEQMLPDIRILLFGPFSHPEVPQLTLLASLVL